ncbi:MAG: hypothetical protein IPP73_12575 [Chitinophagaceae bacterium]|nr:hypothetical protein [Chitinophagaceae bacterium]
MNRYYSFAQTGTTGTDKTSLVLRYLVSELNGNTESKLVLWDHHANNSIDEHGKTNNNTTDHWVGLTGLTVTYIAPVTLDSKEYSLADYTSTKNTWSGSISTDWNVLGNWTAGNVPFTTDEVLIPDVSSASNRFPVLTSDVEIKSMEIAAGASLSGATYTLAINGYLSAWQNSGTFIPGTGTVSFIHGNISHTVSTSGTTQFNNLNIAANTFVRPGAGSITKISGSVTGDLSAIVDLTAFNNTVEYNGTDQYIVNPSTVGYPNRDITIW